MPKRIVFLGAGNMASAIIKSLNDVDICIYDKNKNAYDKFNEIKDINIKYANTAGEAIEYSDYIILAFKPQNMEESLTGLYNEAGNPCKYKSKLFISIVAGITIKRICELLKTEAAVIRTIPNTPMMVGKGVIAVTKNNLVNDADFEFVCDIFKKTCEIITVPEEHINPITSVTSSAPAYVYLFIKAIYESALEQGLNYENMLSIICNMVVGSAEMLLKTGMLPDDMIKMVASPNGTTEAALKVFYENNFNDIIKKAMINCTRRAIELSEIN